MNETPKETGQLRKSRRRGKDSQRANDSQNIDQLTRRFLREIGSLQLASSEIIAVLGKNTAKHAESYQKFIDQHSVPNLGEEVHVKIPVDKISEFERVMRDLSIAAGAIPLSYEALFLVLVSKWDAFIGNMLRWIYATQPEIIHSSNRNISYADLMEINSLDSARVLLVDQEVEAVLRESHVDHFSYLERKLKLSLREGLDIWPTFVELTQRRHLIAHAAGRVSHQYLKICSENRVQLAKNAVLGTELVVDPEYFSHSCDCLTKLGFKLSQVLWRKLQPEGRDDAEASLIKTTLDMIDADQCAPAIKILTFALKPPIKFNDARGRLVCVINLAQAYKWLGQHKKCNEVLAGEDWSAANVDFRLALAVLNDEFDSAANLMKNVGPRGEIKKENYESWPVFREFRKTPMFASTFKDVFGVDVETRSVPSGVSMLSQVKASDGSDDSLN